MTTRNTQPIQCITPTLHVLKCERNRYTISYTFWRFLSAIITESLYRLSCAFRTGPQCEAQSFANTLK